MLTPQITCAHEHVHMCVGRQALEEQGIYVIKWLSVYGAGRNNIWGLKSIRGLEIALFNLRLGFQCAFLLFTINWSTELPVHLLETARSGIGKGNIW